MAKQDPLVEAPVIILKTFPDHVLRDLGRNDAAPHEYRKQAVEILIARKSPLAKLEDLRQFVHELNVELEDIQFEHPAPSGPGPMTAGVTTATMFGQDVIDNTPDESENVPPIKPDSVPAKSHKKPGPKPKDTKDNLDAPVTA